jgi:bifunctional non-homologous end joining protein LigD
MDRPLASVVEAIGRLGPQRLVLDGEVVIVQPDGTTDFQALQNSLRQGRFKDHVYFAFDLLYCDGYDLTPCPLEARKQFLHTLLADRGGDAQTVRFSDYVRGQGDAMFQHACRFAVEGLVSKQVDGPYVSGRSRQWLKSKCLLRQEFVVVGFTRPQGTRLHFGALLLGYYDAQQRLVYCGRVGTGFTAESLAELSGELRRRTIGQRPVKVVPADADTRGVTWVRPELVAEVEFAQWTKEGVLRQASFQGLREDKDPREVVRELPAAGRRRGTAPPARRGSARQAASSRGGPSRRSVKPSTRRSEKSSGRGGVRVAGVLLSHPEKILYPEQRVAKVDLASYYERVAPWILPQLAGRPLSLVRCPEGHNQDCFYQKHVAESMPETIQSAEVQEKSGTKRYVMIEDLPGLVALVQLGVLEIHPWGCRKDRIDRPDRLVIDLDPGPGVDWAAVVEAAHLVRVVLEKVSLKSFVRTTGGKGLHVVVPLARRNDWSEAKQFARTLAERLAGRWPEHFVATSAHAKRTGKIYVDYLRNARGATAIASYSTRARPGATVATPVTWDELTPELHPEDYHIGTVPERLARLSNDPWAGLSESRQSLNARRQSGVAR